MVIATQNPVEYRGTYPLPEAQLDRFAVRLELGYGADAESEMAVVTDQREHHPLSDIDAVVTTEDVLLLQAHVRDVAVEESVCRDIVTLVRQRATTSVSRWLPVPGPPSTLYPMSQEARRRPAVCDAGRRQAMAPSDMATPFCPGSKIEACRRAQPGRCQGSARAGARPGLSKGGDAA